MIIYVYQQFLYLVCLEILNTYSPPKIPYIYNILKVCKNILTSSAFPAPSPPGNTLFFLGT